MCCGPIGADVQNAGLVVDGTAPNVLANLGGEGGETVEAHDAFHGEGGITKEKRKENGAKEERREEGCEKRGEQREER